MAYDERLANRVRQAFGARHDITERKMFGGLAFLCRGHMCCGIVGNDLMVRIPEDEIAAVMRSRHVRPMDFTGKPLKGFVYVSPPGFRTAATLRAWLARGERVAEEKAIGPTKRRPSRNTASSGSDRRAIPSVAGRAEIRPDEIRPRRSVSRRSGNPVQ
jgi:TfoX N-terminal domain